MMISVEMLGNLRAVITAAIGNDVALVDKRNSPPM